MPGLFHIRSRCRRGCGHDWRSFFVGSVHAELDLVVVEVVGMTGVDFL